MPHIKLNFINNSNDENNSSVVIFQKNQAETATNTAVAWRVIKLHSKGSFHPFTYPIQSFVAAADSYGNQTPQLPASSGESFNIVQSTSGMQLQLAGKVAGPEIQISNGLQQGAASAFIYKSGHLLGEVSGLAPGQSAMFDFRPELYLGVVKEMQEGQLMDAAVLSELNDIISLMGIVSADIILSGGGSGIDSTPFIFTLENIAYA